MKITNTINTAWSDYDKTVAKCQLCNYGKIFLDEYDLPLDNDHLIEDHIQNFAKEVVTVIDTYKLYKNGTDDFTLYAINGDWSVRGNKADVAEELTDLGLSFDNFQ